MSEDRRISFTVGRGAWTLVAWDGHSAYVRFALSRDRTSWRIAEARFVEPSGDVLRSFPFSRVEYAANANRIVALALSSGHDRDVPDEVPEMFAGYEPVKLDRPKLRRPKGKRLGRNFYEEVALAYYGAIADGLDPRQTLARDSGAAPDTVARWIGTARKLGLLSPTTPGKVSVVVETPIPGGATAGGFAPREEIGERDDG